MFKSKKWAYLNDKNLNNQLEMGKFRNEDVRLEL